MAEFYPDPARNKCQKKQKKAHRHAKDRGTVNKLLLQGSSADRDQMGYESPEVIQGE
jgi:hypothetical protein